MVTQLDMMLQRPTAESSIGKFKQQFVVRFECDPNSGPFIRKSVLLAI